MYKILAKPFFIGKNIVFMSSCHSTNDVASDLLKAGDVQEGTIVITDHQSKGRGQQGNHWEADPGKNITCSVILKPKTLLISDQFLLNVITSLAIADLVSDVLTIESKVKWPNDIYCLGDKICGILINNYLKKDCISSAVIGIGLNVNQRSFDIDNATSLSTLSGNATYDLPQILESLVLSIEKRYFQWKNDEATLWQEYLSKLYWKDEIRTFIAGGKYFTGVIRDVTKQGQLVVEKEQGLQPFDFKTISFIK